MTPGAFRSARKELGLSQAGMAEFLRLPPANGARQVRRMEAGTRPISGAVAALILAATTSNQARQALGVRAIAQRRAWGRRGPAPA